MAVESVLTRDEVTVFFERRQEALDNLDADALRDDYADDCVVESRVAGTLQRGRRPSIAPGARGSRRFPTSSTGPIG